MYGWPWWAACAVPGAPPPAAPERPPITVFDAPQWVPTDVPGAYRLRIATDVPVSLALALDDGVSIQEVRYAATTSRHDVPVLGLRPERDVRIGVTLTDQDGHSTTLTPLLVRTRPLDVDLPDFDVLVHEVDAIEPGITVLPLETESAAVIAAIDAHGEPLWALPTPAAGHGLKLFGDAELVMVADGRVLHTDALGGFRTLYGDARFQPDVDVDLAHAFHDDVLPGADGTFTALSAEARHVDEFPINPRDPYRVVRTMIRADVILTFDVAGEVHQRLLLADLLDTRRVGFDSVSGGIALPDWAATNALVPFEGGFVVSAGHQDAIVAVNGSPPAVRWVVGHPLGWRLPWAEHRLSAASGLAWPFLPHTPDVSRTPDGIRLLVFDTGSHARTSPYGGTPHPDGDYSRVVEYLVDESTSTVTETFELVGDGRGGRLFSPNGGHADVLPITGNVLATYPDLRGEGRWTNADRGLGERTVRVIEADRAGEVVWDLRVSAAATVAPTGWRCDRAIRLGSLYGDLATVTRP